MFILQAAYLSLLRNWELNLRFFWDKVYQNKHTQIHLSYPRGTWAFSWNLLSLKSEALRTFQTLCVPSSLACLKAWWRLSMLLYWKDTEIFSLQSQLIGGMFPVLGKSVFVQYAIICCWKNVKKQIVHNLVKMSVILFLWDSSVT